MVYRVTQLIYYALMGVFLVSLLAGAYFGIMDALEGWCGMKALDRAWVLAGVYLMDSVWDWSSGMGGLISGEGWFAGWFLVVRSSVVRSSVGLILLGVGGLPILCRTRMVYIWHIVHNTSVRVAVHRRRGCEQVQNGPIPSKHTTFRPGLYIHISSCVIPIYPFW